MCERMTMIDNSVNSDKKATNENSMTTQSISKINNEYVRNYNDDMPL